MLKKIVKSLDGIDESLQKYYEKRGDNYVLKVEGDDDNTALRNAKDREKARADEEAQLRRDAEKKLREVERELGDLKASPETANLQKKLEESEKKFNALQDGLKSTARDNAALDVAREISKAPKLLARFIADRLSVDIGDDGKPVVKATKADGTTADDFTLESLKKEIASSADFKDIIIASKATGGGADQSRTQTAGGAQSTDNRPADLSTMKPTDLVAQIKAKKEAAGAT